jgi:hypothetical protein
MTGKRETRSLNFLPLPLLCNGRRASGEAGGRGALLLLHAQKSGEQREIGIVTRKRKSRS